jgi:RHS repeat-associated protein
MTMAGNIRTSGGCSARPPRCAAVGIVAAIPLLTGMLMPLQADGHAAAGPPAAARQQPVPVYPVKPNTVRVPAMSDWHAPATSWPAAGTATVRLSATGSVRAGSLPVQLGSLPVQLGPGPGAGTASGSAPPSVTVSMQSRQAAVAAGVTGVLFSLAAAGPAASGQRVHVSLDYSSFAYSDGGDYASRLHLVELPACALTTPQQPACRLQTPLASADDVHATELGADVSLAAGAVLAATTSASGSGGDYTATPLSEAGTWAEAGSSGAFTYSYPIQVPPVPGGLEPDISLNYNSQLVDGLTSSDNTQASWIGDGWDYSPGYIERDYQPCSQNSASSQQTGDSCWSSDDTTTLSLNGQQTTLVQDDSTGTWRAESDGNEKISYKTGTVNGTHDGDYWVITDPDGTSYYFGLNQLPGWTSGDTATDSSWNLPVYAPTSGQPCYNSTFSASHCVQAWRWNLDYVTDAHGDAVAYFYDAETNYYASGTLVGSTGTTTANASYTQAGALATIEYGLRAGAVYGHTPAGQVTFKTAEDRTDVPTDLSCSNGASCQVISPTFWGKYQLTTISTQALEGSALASVDSWALAQKYPTTGDPTTPASLWLSGITRTGADTAGGGSSASLPAVSFFGTPLANRVMTTADKNSGYSIITRLRLTMITTETGGTIGIAYDTPSGACTSGNFPAPDANTALCYPDYWTPPGTSSPVLDWFNKYVVTAVTQTNTVGGGVAVPTSYSYAGAAWHYDDDSLTRSKNRTWDSWRGFRTVTTETGAAPDPVTKTVDTYFQGMNGDYQSGGGTSTVSLTSTRGDTVADSDQFAAMPFEHVVYDGTSGGEVSDTITIPWTSAVTASQSQPSPLPPLQAFLTDTAQTKTYTPLSSGGTRESEISYTHDAYGRVTSESDVPDTTDASQTTCTTTTYATNTSAWILDLASEVTVVSVACGATVTLPADAVSDTLTYYDGATSLSSDTPSKGDVTETQTATSYSGATPVYTTQSIATYDEYGRVLTATDADNRETITAYTPASGAEVSSESVTDPMGLLTTTVYDPARDLPVQVTNPAGYVTSETYDGLGRLTAVWLPGHPKASSAADYTFSYTVSDSAPSVVTTNTLNDTGAYTVSETLYDSLGREAETQTATPDGGRDITDVYYNSQGQQSLESDPYYTTGAPSGTLVAAPDNQVPSQTGYVYDGDGRVVRQISYKLTAETWETDTAYDGEATTVSYQNLVSGQPTGGTPQTTFTDGRGLTSKIYQYHTGVSADPSDPASDYDVTSYTYTPAQQLATITDAAGNKWSYTYDLLGDQASQADPDSGASHSIYDAAGQLVSVTDARGKTISYTYDGDGRKLAEYDTTGGALENSGDEIASWTYDTLKKGMLTSSSSYYGGQAYTQKVIGYGSSGLPTGSETIIPAGQGALTGTYETGDTYDPDTMALSSYYDAAAGGLPAETVGIGYDTAGDPVSLGSYVTSLSYTEYSQPLQYTLGPSTSPVYLTDSYDQQTQRLTGSQVVIGSSEQTVDATSYSYDNVGNVLSESSASSGAAQVQCFQYDYLGRLSQAWAQGTGGCTSPSAAAEGAAAAPYWDKYSYSVTGNLTSQISTQPSGASVTTTNGYPAAGAAQPHAITSASVTGSGTTSYGHDAAGDVTSITSPSQSQSLSWDDAGRLSSVTTNSATTSYLYDADGTLLLQKDPGSTTLYLGDEQIVLTGSTLSGTRYYSIGGVTVAARTSSGSVDYLFGDREGTALLSVDSSSQVVTRRYYDPYGNPIGAPPSAWPGSKGFVGGTADPATGLTNLDAREYNPSTEAFVSPDPLLNPYDPQDLNAYGYATDNPSTDEDPSGAWVCMPDGPCGSAQSFSNPSGANHKAGEGGSSESSPSSDPFPYSPYNGNILYGTSAYAARPAPPPPPRPVVHKKTNGSSAASWISACENQTHTVCANPPSRQSDGGLITTILRGVGLYMQTIRPPDYVTGEVSDCSEGYCYGAQFSIMRDGEIYAGPSVGSGTPGADTAVRVGYIDQSHAPSRNQQNSFGNGVSYSVSGSIPLLPLDVGPEVSMAETWGNPYHGGWSNFSSEVGIAFGAGENLYIGKSYSWDVTQPVLNFMVSRSSMLCRKQRPYSERWNNANSEADPDPDSGIERVVVAASRQGRGRRAHVIRAHHHHPVRVPDARELDSGRGKRADGERLDRGPVCRRRDRLGLRRHAVGRAAACRVDHDDRQPAERRDHPAGLYRDGLRRPRRRVSLHGLDRRV